MIDFIYLVLFYIYLLFFMNDKNKISNINVKQILINIDIKY